MGKGSLDALVHWVDNEFAPAISQEAGFVAYFMLATGAGTPETVSVFHDRASGQQSNQLAADYVRENLGEFELRRTEMSGGEVLVSRATSRALEDTHGWRSGMARRRSP
jgi:hypothetical protein